MSDIGTVKKAADLADNRSVVVSVSRELDGFLQVEHEPEGVRVEFYDFLDLDVEKATVEAALRAALVRAEKVEAEAAHSRKQVDTLARLGEFVVEMVAKGIARVERGAGPAGTPMLRIWEPYDEPAPVASFALDHGLAERVESLVGAGRANAGTRGPDVSTGEE